MLVNFKIVPLNRTQFDLKQAADTWGGVLNGDPFQLHVARAMDEWEQRETDSITKQITEAFWNVVRQLGYLRWFRSVPDADSKGQFCWKGQPIVKNITDTSFQLLEP